jgi:signal transduction histidine kinase
VTQTSRTDITFTMTIVRDKRLPWILLLACAILTRPQTALAVDAGTLTTARQVHDLSAAEAREARPVNLEGVVTYTDRSGTLFVSDWTGGIYVTADRKPDDLKFGMLVRISGTTAAGDFAPVIHANSVTPSGVGTLPSPHVVSLDDLASGGEDCEWVEIRGIVRASGVSRETGFAEFRMATGGGQLRVQIAGLETATNLERFVDARVRLRGAVGGIFNQKRQLVAAKLFVPTPDQVVVEEPAPPEPFEVPVRPVKSLLQYIPRSSHGHRVKIRGAVTFAQLPRSIFVRDATQGIEIRGDNEPPLSVGDVVEVIGFPAVGEWTPLLEDATVRKVGSITPPQPAVVTPREALEGDFDSELVQVRATLGDYVRRPEGEVLLLESGEQLFNALLPGPGLRSSFAGLPKGSLLRVTGICQVQVGGPGKYRLAFRLLLRSPADVAVLSQPPWWTLARILRVLAMMTAVVLLALFWVFVLGRRVRAQTALIRQKLHKEAVLEERGRIAKDIHDELGSSLTRIMMLGERAEEDLARREEVGGHLKKIIGSARSTVQTLEEIVWAVNPENDTVDGLVGFITHYADQFFESTNVHCRLEMPVELSPGTLPAEARHSLFLVVKEALNNILKHSRATEVQLRVFENESSLEIVIEDNGVGFDTSTPNARRSGNGLENMRKRVEGLGGTFVITSAPGKGTRLVAKLKQPIAPG